jgi:hypothetical protein
MPNYWVWTAPDGEAVRLATEIPETTETKIELLEQWYASKSLPFRLQRNIAAFEIITGEKYNRAS